TVQDPDNLSDIKSVGELQEDGTYKMSILSCGKNLFDLNYLKSTDKVSVSITNDELYLTGINGYYEGVICKIKLKPNTNYVFSRTGTILVDSGRVYTEIKNSANNILVSN